MNTKRRLLPIAALLALSAPAGAQTLTPPAVLGAAKTIQFTATEFMGRTGVPVKVSDAFLAQPNKAFVQDMDPKTKVISTVELWRNCLCFLPECLPRPS